MELFQVRYYLAVCRTKNFTRAAEECNVSQPALSRAIQQLEAELGGELFRRERSLTHMTDLGRAVYPALGECYEAAGNAKSIATGYLKQGHAPLNLSLSRTMELELLSPLLSEITEGFPQIEIKIFRGSSQEIFDRLKNGDTEIAISGALDEDWDRLNTRKLFEERYGLLMHRAHALSRHNSVQLNDLVDERLLCWSNCTPAEELEKRLRQISNRAIAKHEVPLVEDIADLVRAKFGVGVWPATRRLAEDLALRDVHDVEMSRWIHVYTVAGRKLSPATSALINLLRARDWGEMIEAKRQAAEALH
jgi:DNA-binding transcriptional LysR family regulator